MARGRPASSRPTGRRKWRSSFTRSRRRITWQAFASACLSATRRWSTACFASRATWTPACSAPFSLPPCAPCVCLNSWLTARNAIYAGRRDRMLAAFRRLGVEVDAPAAGLYLWPRIPAGLTSQQFAHSLLDRADLAVTPGTNFGAQGEGYVRVSLTTPDARLDEAIARLEAAIPAWAG